MKVLVVESPAKAKTINKYLGSDFTVLASYGHIRDLPAKDGSVRPDDDFAMDWETDPKSERHIKDIAQALKGADKLFLATDPDREGEAISWHVRKVLEERKALKGVEVKRVVFNEITKSAILEAVKSPRDVDQQLVDAYLARRALDYLVGFTLSPVLWRKLPGSRSAGRVQSVALRLICEREAEIERFISQEYWTVAADLKTPRGDGASFALTHLGGAKLDKFDLPSQESALKAQAAIEADSFSVAKIERKKSKRNPFPPFTTSTLQQEASRKLYFSASRTMQLAQRLYEGIDLAGETVGLITYMRTDGVQMASEAIAAARDMIGKEYGKTYVPDAPRIYKTKAKNAQEAHECIRPTDMFRRPEAVARFLDKDQLALYELIWKRTAASQMASAELDQVAVDLAGHSKQTQLRATGSVVTFDGFLKVYREDHDDKQGEHEDTDRLLPVMNEGERMTLEAVRPTQHFTQPLPRFSEASLVKRLEELGIGRPSTYASILTVLQDRNYVRLDQRRFIPEDRGRLVTAFLEQYFKRYVEYNFTADLENQLDEISDGKIQWKEVLEKFWRDFHASVDGTKELRVADVIDALDAELGTYFFPATAESNDPGHDPRQCKLCQTGRLSLKLGKFGAFIGCSNYPECRYTRPLGTATGDSPDEGGDQTRELGVDPATQLPVSVRKGPYGWYIQSEAPAAPTAPPALTKSGKPKKVTAPKPKRVSLHKGLDPKEVTLEVALALLALPRDVATHPETGKVIQAGIGRFGPYLLHDGRYKNLSDGDDVLTIGANRAVALLAEAKGQGKGRAPLRTLGEKDGNSVTVNEGRFGPYVALGKVYATIPKASDPATITLEEALALIAAKAEKNPAKPTKARTPTPAAKRATPQKSASKKPAAKKTAAKPGKAAAE